MANILYLVHRIPYPPNKGDKVRSFHLLEWLARRYRVFLGTFVDDPADLVHVETLRQWCAEVRAVRISPRLARLRSLSGLLLSEPLSLPYYRSAELRGWIDAVINREGIGQAVVFSSQMVQYVTDRPLDWVADYCDVDSAKWAEYADRQRWPMSWLYRREGERLLAFERRAAARSQGVFFVTPAEADLFRELAPEVAAKVQWFSNGVDADYFSPDFACASPFSAGEVPIVFTGAMDYWPNIDAVTWFADAVLPRILARQARARFWIVGMNPVPAVRALTARPGISVTGTVPDVRPYVRHAAVVVAPLRVARGVQNKVLEAMAMGRPVVASESCAAGISAARGEEFEAASGPAEFADKVIGLCDSARGARLGRAARRRVLEAYDWETNLERIAPSLAADHRGSTTMQSRNSRLCELLA